MPAQGEEPSSGIGEGGGGDGNLLTREVFYRVLASSVDGMCVRYKSMARSRAMHPQWVVDVAVLLRWALRFASAGGYRGEAVAGEVDARGEDARPRPQPDIDCLRAIERSVATVASECLDMLAYLAASDARGSELRAWGATGGGAGERGGKGHTQGPDSMLSAAAAMLENERLDELFEPARFSGADSSIGTIAGGAARIDALLVNAFLSGTLDGEAELYNAILANPPAYDWAWLRLDRDVMKEAVGKRHELGEWEYPELSEAQKADKGTLEEFLRGL